MFSLVNQKFADKDPLIKRELYRYELFEWDLAIVSEEMEKDGLIQFVKKEEKRKNYIITELGKEILTIELKRIERLYKNSRGEDV